MNFIFQGEQARTLMLALNGKVLVTFDELLEVLIALVIEDIIT
jgi:hypothetical protein